MILQRVQLSRRKGWRMPPNTVKVDRTTPFGNPYQAGKDGDGDRAHLVKLFREHMQRPEQAELRAKIRTELVGKHLACWCPPGEPCHADVLLDIASSPRGGWWDGHEHYDRGGYCDNPARGY